MPRKRVIVRAFDDGRIELEADGYRGSSCEEATEFLSGVLGQTTDSRKKTEWWLRNGREVRRNREQFGVETNKLCG